MPLIRRVTVLLTLLFVVSVVATANADAQRANGKLKVFVLAGQSNMLGFGTVLGDKPGTMQTVLKENPASTRT